MISLMVLPGGRDYDHMVMQQYLQQCEKPDAINHPIQQPSFYRSFDIIPKTEWSLVPPQRKELVTVTASFIDIIYLNMPC